MVTFQGNYNAKNVTTFRVSYPGRWIKICKTQQKLKIFYGMKKQFVLLRKRLKISINCTSEIYVHILRVQIGGLNAGKCQFILNLTCVKKMKYTLADQFILLYWGLTFCSWIKPCTSDTNMRLLSSGFFHKSYLVPRPQVHTPKIFKNIFVFS